jgi:crossover junction endodeoxyribonuclease RusA
LIKLTVSDIPPSNNESQGQGGVKKALAYQGEKKKWSGYFQALRMRMRAQLQQLDLPLQEATIITVYNFKSKARRDPDNYSGKMIHDGLAAAGFIVDDSFKQLDIIPLATFGNERESVDVYIIQGKRLLDFANKLINEEDFKCGAI